MKKTIAATTQPLPRALQMTLVAAHEQSDQQAIRHTLTTNPEHREAMTTFLLSLAALDMPEQAPSPELDDLMAVGLARGLARIAPAPTTAPANLTSAFKVAGVTQLQVARQLRLGTDILRQMADGRIAIATIPQKFFARLAEVLHTTLDDVRLAVEGSYSARLKPALRRKESPDTLQAFAEVVSHNLNMTDAERQEWLRED